MTMSDATSRKGIPSLKLSKEVGLVFVPLAPRDGKVAAVKRDTIARIDDLRRKTIGKQLTYEALIQ